MDRLRELSERGLKLRSLGGDLVNLLNALAVRAHLKWWLRDLKLVDDLRIPSLCA